MPSSAICGGGYDDICSELTEKELNFIEQEKYRHHHIVTAWPAEGCVCVCVCVCGGGGVGGFTSAALASSTFCIRAHND